MALMTSPSVNFSNNFVSMEHFRGQQLQDAVNCSQKFSSLRPLKEDSVVTPPLSEYCFDHPQMKLDLFCKQCGVDVCRECTTTRHRRHKYTASSDKIHEETRRLGEATDSMVEVLEEMKLAISGVKEMKQRVRNRKDNNINVTREVFATLRKAIDEREEQTIADIEEEAYKREKALEVKNFCAYVVFICPVLDDKPFMLFVLPNHVILNVTQGNPGYDGTRQMTTHG